MEWQGLENVLHCSGVGRFPEVVRPTKAAHAQKSYTAPEGVAARHAHAGCALVCFPDLYTGGCTPGDVSKSEAESSCMLHAL